MEELALSGPSSKKQKVSGAIRTDLILSAEIMAVALADVADQPLGIQAAALVIVGVLLTVRVYQAVALIVKDGRRHRPASREGRRGIARLLVCGLVKAMPWTMEALTPSPAAMLWVGGGIIVHGPAVSPGPCAVRPGSRGCRIRRAGAGRRRPGLLGWPSRWALGGRRSDDRWRFGGDHAPMASSRARCICATEKQADFLSDLKTPPDQIPGARYHRALCSAAVASSSGMLGMSMTSRASVQTRVSG